MRSAIKKVWLITILIVGVFTNAVSAQSRADLHNERTVITWLGLDFSQTKFIGSATEFKDVGVITNDKFRDDYTAAWNQLFINEQKKYDVAAALHRGEVKYAMNVTAKANSVIKKDFFSNDPDNYKTLDEAKIAQLVKAYNFQGKEGVGLLFFVEGMSKGKEEASAWVTFVDMDSRTVLLTMYETGKPGGFGFRNYWAKAFFNILKHTGSDF